MLVGKLERAEDAVTIYNDMLMATPEDEEVIKEIPPREILEMASKIRDMIGIIHDSRA